jgi:hypothetical protein
MIYEYCLHDFFWYIKKLLKAPKELIYSYAENKSQKKILVVICIFVQKDIMLKQEIKEMFNIHVFGNIF